MPTESERQRKGTGVVFFCPVSVENVQPLCCYFENKISQTVSGGQARWRRHPASVKNAVAVLDSRTSAASLQPVRIYLGQSTRLLPKCNIPVSGGMGTYIPMSISLAPLKTHYFQKENVELELLRPIVVRDHARARFMHYIWEEKKKCLIGMLICAKKTDAKR